MTQKFHSQVYTREIENMHSQEDSIPKFLAALFVIAMDEFQKYYVK